MIFSESLYGALWAVRECNETGSCKNAHLSHTAAKQLACTPCFEDELFATNHDAADRRGEPLAQAEGCAVGIGHKVTYRYAQCNCRIKEACAIDVDWNAVWLECGAQLAHIRRRNRSAERVGVTVLNDDERGDGTVWVARVLNPLHHIGDRHLAVGVFADDSQPGAGDHGVVCRLIVVDVPFSGGDDLATTRHLRHDRDQVPHGPRGNEETGLLTQQGRGSLL